MTDLFHNRSMQRWRIKSIEICFVILEHWSILHGKLSSDLGF